ncbi:MAG: hypothetical protein HQL15_04155 [Candidatus Omnitrophica bacterium]|nr:hypothetical protein [Candidatus Omnitrophota bacterium]
MRFESILIGDNFLNILIAVAFVAPIFIFLSIERRKRKQKNEFDSIIQMTGARKISKDKAEIMLNGQRFVLEHYVHYANDAYLDSQSLSIVINKPCPEFLSLYSIDGVRGLGVAGESRISQIEDPDFTSQVVYKGEPKHLINDLFADKEAREAARRLLDYFSCIKFEGWRCSLVLSLPCDCTDFSAFRKALSALGLKGILNDFSLLIKNIPEATVADKRRSNVFLLRAISYILISLSLIIFSLTSKLLLKHFKHDFKISFLIWLVLLLAPPLLLIWILFKGKKKNLGSR